MNFSKDILLFDLETTDANPELAEPTQLGAILLDRETLEEKDHFLTFIKADLSKGDPEALAVSGITVEDLKGAPPLEVALKNLTETFPGEYLLSSWVEYLDRRVLMKMFKQVGTTYPFDYHFLDLWPIAYAHLVKNGYTGPMNSQEMFTAFGFDKRTAHNALEDCRIEADILRKIILDK